MIRAKHRKWAHAFFGWYFKHIIRNNFSAFYVTNPMPEIDDKKPVLFAPNHISWWDGFFMFLLIKEMTTKRCHLMMLESQLSKHWYFSRVGAYSIEPGNMRGVIKSLSYTGKLLSDPLNAVIMYPQGEIQPYWIDKPTIGRGIFGVAAKNPGICICIPIFCINPYNEKYPEIYVRFSKPLTAAQLSANHGLYTKVFLETRASLNRTIIERSCGKNILTGK